MSELEVFEGPTIAVERPRIELHALRHPRVLRVSGGVVALLSTLFVTWWIRFRPFVSTDDARVAAPTVAVAPEGNAGRVVRVLVREGDAVAPGQVLVELDDAAERVQVERAQSALATAEARAGQAEAQLELERRLWSACERRARAGLSSAEAARRRTENGARAEEIAKARAGVDAARSAADKARLDLSRAMLMSSVQAISTADLESARAAAESAQANLESSRAALALFEHGSRPEDISISRGAVEQAQAELVEASAGPERVLLRSRQLDEARSLVAQARAELALAQVARDRMTLRSSMAGTVVRVFVVPGDHLASGQGAVTIVDLAQAWIAANIEETSSGLVNPGQAVQISVDEGGELSGRVDVVTRSAASQFALIPADSSAGNFTKVVQRIPIRIALDASPRVERLRAGQSVEIKIRVRR